MSNCSDSDCKGHHLPLFHTTQGHRTVQSTAPSNLDFTRRLDNAIESRRAQRDVLVGFFRIPREEGPLNMCPMAELVTASDCYFVVDIGRSPQLCASMFVSLPIQSVHQLEHSDDEISDNRVHLNELVQSGFHGSEYLMVANTDTPSPPSEEPLSLPRTPPSIAQSENQTSFSMRPKTKTTQQSVRNVPNPAKLLDVYPLSHGFLFRSRVSMWTLGDDEQRSRGSEKGRRRVDEKPGSRLLPSSEFDSGEPVGCYEWGGPDEKPAMFLRPEKARQNAIWSRSKKLREEKATRCGGAPVARRVQPVLTHLTAEKRTCPMAELVTASDCYDFVTYIGRSTATTREALKTQKNGSDRRAQPLSFSTYTINKQKRPQPSRHHAYGRSTNKFRCPPTLENDEDPCHVAASRRKQNEGRRPQRVPVIEHTGGTEKKVRTLYDETDEDHGRNITNEHARSYHTDDERKRKRGAYFKFREVIPVSMFSEEIERAGVGVK
ncbi:hypothetical protein BXZ70DRAFT_1080916 [Cristinia sonorae]|uniref:Uncharacterized protein n=1 Tax=Cristinia sonorae TaxID=1940300 RepID=A0A8K0UEX5_9AGAR|nr:hypothetical protein BXZ70DRAFT_1080916 [Cristinia sonorae]